MSNRLYHWLILCWGIALLSYPSLGSDREVIAGEEVEQSADPMSVDGDYLSFGYGGEADLPPPAASVRKLGVGAQVLIQSNSYRGGDTVTMVLPMVSYVGERFFVITPRAGIHLYRHPLGGINAIADWRFKGEAFENKGFLAGMAERKNTAMAGLDGHLRLPGRYRVDLSAITDILDRHRGQEVNLALTRVYRFDQLLLIPGSGVVWRSADFNNYYYGVRASEATPDRPAYNPGDDLEWFARLAVRYSLNENWSLAGAVRVEVLSSDVRNSPIVRNDYLAAFIAGVNYFF